MGKSKAALSIGRKMFEILIEGLIVLSYGRPEDSDHGTHQMLLFMLGYCLENSVWEGGLYRLYDPQDRNI